MMRKIKDKLGGLSRVKKALLSGVAFVVAFGLVFSAVTIGGQRFFGSAVKSEPNRTEVRKLETSITKLQDLMKELRKGGIPEKELKQKFVIFLKEDISSKQESLDVLEDGHTTLPPKQTRQYADSIKQQMKIKESLIDKLKKEETLPPKEVRGVFEKFVDKLIKEKEKLADQLKKEAELSLEKAQEEVAKAQATLSAPLKYVKEVYMGFGSSRDVAINNLKADIKKGEKREVNGTDVLITEQDADLNRGAGGDFIFMGYSTTNEKNEALTNIAVTATAYKNSKAYRNWDLNKGAKGAYVSIVNYQHRGKEGDTPIGSFVIKNVSKKQIFPLEAPSITYSNVHWANKPTSLLIGAVSHFVDAKAPLNLNLATLKGDNLLLLCAGAIS
jgi:hypothetical protein